MTVEAIQAETGALFVDKNGPRIWLPRGSAEFPQVDSRFLGEIEMRLLATIIVDPDELSQSTNAEPYTEFKVLRNTIYEYPAGSEVYELTSPDGAIYTMQSVLLTENPDLSVENLPSLGSVFSLPEGWTYEARRLNEELILIVEEEAIVMRDDLGNTYQRRTVDNSSEVKVGYETHQILSPNEIITWASQDITQAEFNAIELPQE